MNGLALVSVIVPAYNCESIIAETLDSLFAQTYPKIEIVVVNDGSKDCTLDILKSYGNKIRLIDQSNAGVSDARNTGIRVAQGDYISFCDADDIWAHQKVQEQVSYLLKHPKVGMVYTAWYVWGPEYDGRFTIPPGFEYPEYGQEIDLNLSGWIYHKLLLDCICLTSTVMIRKNIIDQVGFFNINLRIGEDYEYWLRTSRITEIHKLKSQLVLYRTLLHSISHMPTPIHYEYLVLQNALKQWGSIGPNGEQNKVFELRDRLANMRFGFGYLHLKSGDPKIAFNAFMHAIREKPLWYLPWLYLLFSLLKIALSFKLSLRKS